ncbi:hypothetical protein HN51_048845 [Arachis hypogaea]|nr:uncharacterized protein DS421_12g381350 [Arachis hypogaea]
MNEQKEMQYVCFKTLDMFYGIDVSDLLSPPKELEDQAVLTWASLPPIPAAFKADLPAFCMQLVEFDSNFYLLGGLQNRPFAKSRFGPPSFKTFQLHLEEDNEKQKQKQLTFKEVDSISKPPMCYAKMVFDYEKIKKDYYFIQFDPMMPRVSSDSFWVLPSQTRDWQPLPSPPDLGLSIFDVLETNHFVYDEKIYFQTIYMTNDGSMELKSKTSSPSVGDMTDDAFMELKSKTSSPNVGELESVLFYSFDPSLGGGTWTIQGGADAFIESFSFTVQGRQRFHRPITLPLPVRGDYSLHLSTSDIERSDHFGEWKNGYKATLHALLVNKRGVRFVQPIEGCFEGIQPAFFAACPTLVYLDNNMVCAMLIGFLEEHHKRRCPLFCVSIFQLSIMEDAIDMDYINSPAHKKVHNFLTVNVIRRNVYSMVDYLERPFIRRDIYPFIDEIKEFLWIESKDLLSPVSKKPKLI